MSDPLSNSEIAVLRRLRAQVVAEGWVLADAPVRICRENALFLIAANNLAPRLLDEVESLRASLSTAEKERSALMAERDHAQIVAEEMEDQRATARISADAMGAQLLDLQQDCIRQANALRELLRLYDWRFDLGGRDEDPRGHPIRDVSGEFRRETRRLLLQYGAEKKAAWSVARAVLYSGSVADAAPAANKASDSSALEKALEGMRGERDDERLIAQGWETKYEDASSALEKALGALRAAVGMLQECVVAIGASEYEYTSDDTRAMLLMAKVVDWLTLNEASGGAHVDALKGMK